MRPVTVVWSVAWSLLLAVLLLGPALGPGYVLTYDMVWVPDLVLRPDVLGVGSALPRAVPSDAVVAVLDEVLGGQLLQKVVLLGALVGGGLGVARLVAALPTPAVLAAISVYQWSPFVVERLLIGHWPVLVGYAVLPWVLLLGRVWRETGRMPPLLLLLVPLGSLSISAGIATAVALLVATAGSRRRTLVAMLVAVAANAPWLVSGLLHAGAGLTDPAGARVFALADEGAVPAPLAALTLGGIWNAEVVPQARTGPLGWMALGLVLALAAAGWRTWRRTLGRGTTGALAVCWLVGTGAALLTWAAPGAVAWLAAEVPGGGVLRDGSRLLVLAAPAVATLAAAGAARLAALGAGPDAAAVRVVVAGGLVVLPVLLLPDALLGAGGRLAAVDYPDDLRSARAAVAAAAIPGDVLVLPLSSYRQPGWNDDRKVLDPLPRLQPRGAVASDELVVSGATLTGEDARVRAAAAALLVPDVAERAEALRALGIGLVLLDRTAPGADDVPDELAAGGLHDGDLTAVTTLPPGAEPPGVPTGWIVAMALAWVAFLGGPVAAVGLGAARLRRVGGDRAGGAG